MSDLGRHHDKRFDTRCPHCGRVQGFVPVDGAPPETRLTCGSSACRKRFDPWANKVR